MTAATIPPASRGGQTGHLKWSWPREQPGGAQARLERGLVLLGHLLEGVRRVPLGPLGVALGGVERRQLLVQPRRDLGRRRRRQRLLERADGTGGIAHLLAGDAQ